MRERIELLGESYTIRPTEGKGTVIQVSWPLGQRGNLAGAELRWVVWRYLVYVAFFKAKKVRFEDQIEVFPYSFHGLRFGKILSLFRGPKLPQNIGRLTNFFLVIFNITRSSIYTDFNR